MAVAVLVTTSSVGFLSGLKLSVVLCYEGQDSFLCFVSLEGDLCPFLKFHF